MSCAPSTRAVRISLTSVRRGKGKKMKRTHFHSRAARRKRLCHERHRRWPAGYSAGRMPTQPDQSDATADAAIQRRRTSTTPRPNRTASGAGRGTPGIDRPRSRPPRPRSPRRGRARRSWKTRTRVGASSRKGWRNMTPAMSATRMATSCVAPSPGSISATSAGAPALAV